MFKFFRRDDVLILLIVISWVLLTIFTFQLTAPGWEESLNKFFHGDKVLVKNIFLTSFFLFVFLFFRNLYSPTKNEKIKTIDWWAYSLNLVCLFLHLIILCLEHYAVPPLELAIWLNILNNFNILIGTIFCANCFFLFKRLILKENSPLIDSVWKVFEYMIYGSAFLTVFNVNVYELCTAMALALYATVALFLSVQMKWVAFLKKKQKIRYIYRFCLFFITFCLILQNFFFESFTFGSSADNLLVIDCAHKFFLLSTFTFVMFYSISSILILLFHLPTASVHEQKINDTKNYKKLSQILNSYNNKEEIYKVLLEVTISSSLGKMAWLNINGEILTENIKQESAEEIERYLKDISENYSENATLIFEVEKLTKTLLYLQSSDVKFILSTPLIINNKEIGTLFILKKKSEGFSKDLIEVTESYVSQACISIENRDLLKQAIDNERYQEEIKIAQGIKSKLLKPEINIGQGIDCSVYSKSADQVGGDYYDYYRFSSNYSLLVLGDVSGHGTGAAFNMAQLKGVFQALTRNVKDLKKYPALFNEVMYECLENESFVTMSFFFIDTDCKEITHYRCGHNPCLFLNNNKIHTLLPKGMGLGMIDNNVFESFLDVEVMNYSKGDILLAYTDGFTEAKNLDNIQFGLDNMKKILLENRDKNSSEIVHDFENRLLKYSKSVEIDDDYTCIALKFN